MEAWDVSRAKDMSRLFAHAKSFDRDLSQWDVSRVKGMSGMFLGATSFNGFLEWHVASSHTSSFRNLMMDTAVRMGQ